jgi:YD repeat-containing protein
VVIQVGTTSTPAANSCLVYNYYPNQATPNTCTEPGYQAVGNNGNLAAYFYQDATNLSLGHTASFTYDYLDRLTNATAAGSSTYNLSYSYDQFGNVTCTGGVGLCTSLNYGANTTTNRIITSGYSYDASGNLTADGTGVGSATYTWDAEGRLRSQTPSGASTVNYTYDALGQLVRDDSGVIGYYILGEVYSKTISGIIS